MAASSRKRRRLIDAADAGWTRSFPHVEGNWASSVSIPVCFSDSDDEEVAEVLEKVAAAAEAAVDRPVHRSSVSKLHISVSRTLGLREPITAPLFTKLKQGLAMTMLGTITLRFSGELVQLTNEQRTRNFIGLRCNSVPPGALARLTDVTDAAFADFGYPPYYDDRIWHCTIASWPTVNVTSDPRSSEISGTKQPDDHNTTVQTIPQTAGAAIEAQLEVLRHSLLPSVAVAPGSPGALTQEDVSVLNRVLETACENQGVVLTVAADHAIWRCGHTQRMLPFQ